MFSSLRRTALRGGVVAAVAAGVALAAASPALAHVTAQPSTAQQGGYTVINFRVPTESDTAGTVKLEVSFPTDHPLTSARTTPQPGWTATVTKGTLPQPIQRDGATITQAVTTVTWTAQPGTRIGPGQYMDFPLSVGPLPDDTTGLVFPATQTYDDGSVVNWNEIQQPGAAEPDHPAPSITLTPATGGGHGGHDAAAAGGTDGSSAGTTDTTARWLGGIGLLLGALGLGLGAGAVLRSRRPKSPTGGSAAAKEEKVTTQ
ncbi:YcnI family copper-binding membrane protein [Pseudonocardia dioxanivorans]|uniref:YcnI family copper-binding membrane protein n=1 Tax=Pseudonocardia dioxanivorans TaxID=240495 RepID=UPI000CCFECD7|nr:YcnI family protein [Pseudonocardia dioxanivorans]